MLDMTEVEQLDPCFPFPVALLAQFSQIALNQLDEMLAIVAWNARLVELTISGWLPPRR
jgi:hypothetical protein